MSEPTHAKATTLGGMLLVLFANINSADIVRTGVLAAIGAAVSYIMSLLIKRVVSWWKARNG